jgi:hypothetical protein
MQIFSHVYIKVAQLHHFCDDKLYYSIPLRIWIIKVKKGKTIPVTGHGGPYVCGT